jgi:TRAP-type C4-dicarboxylate transport system permease small subunit
VARAIARAVRLLDRGVAAVCRVARWLVLPLSLLLFLQWPLRDGVQAFSREANDAAQVLFALYVAVAITEATRRRSHLAVDAFAHAIAPRWRERISRAAALAVLAPWSAMLLASGAGSAWQSLLALEGFPETMNPGYFAIRGAGMILAALVLAQAIVDLCAPKDA